MNSLFNLMKSVDFQVIMMSFKRKSDILTQWLALPMGCSKCNFESLPMGC